MHAPIDVHFATVERIICYVKKDLGRGLLYTEGEELSVEAYMDANYVKILALCPEVMPRDSCPLGLVILGSGICCK